MSEKKTKRKGKDKSGLESDKGLSESEKVINQARDTLAGAADKTSRETSETPSLKEKIAQQEMVNELNQLYSPENFKPLVRAPADLMLLNTNRKLWELREEEVNSLANNMSVTCKYWLLVDPKWLSLAMLGMSIITIYGSRYMLQVKEERKEAREKVNTEKK